MHKYQKEFIELAIKHKVLSFGEFTLKSGRVSPYFFNAGLFQSGLAIASLGQFYAQAIIESGIEIDILFGPAYKGIPLATTTAVALSTQYNLDLPVCYNRKEAKDHGEGGTLVGAPLKGRVAIIDDVITAGTAVREVIKIIQQADAIPSAVIIGLDRQEKGKGEKSAIQEVEETFGIPVVSIVNLDDVIEYIKLQNDPVLINRITHYRHEYGV